MILGIDIGNSNIVIGCINEKKTEFVARISTDILKTKDEYALIISDLFNIYKMDQKKITGAIISSVVPPLTGSIEAAIKLLFNTNPLIVGSGIKTGLNITLDDPAQVGADLVVSAVAAIANYPKPMVIFDMGTATTMSYIDEDGCYSGGMIFPGVIVALEALVDKTAKLPNISFEPPKNIIGKNTIDSMKSGIFYSNASAIDGIIKRVKNQINLPLSAIATGGTAKKIIPFCEEKIHYHEHLMLEGLFLLYQLNKKTK